MATFPENNRTWKIILHAHKHKYAVMGACVYNVDGVMAVIRAAERKRSPAIIQLFPWTMHFQGPHFVQFVAQVAQAASVPIAVHLDHCIRPEDIDLALTCAFDSIMIDGPGSSGALDSSIGWSKIIAKKAATLGITIEAELGRVDGVEDGVDFGAAVAGMLTQPEDARKFAESTGIHFMAPSFGNVHGGYGPLGAEKLWQFNRLRGVASSVQVPLVLHGTHDVSNELIRKVIDIGVSKVNLNKTLRENYTSFLAEYTGKMELTKLKEQAVNIYADDVATMMDVLGSSNRA